MITTERPLFLTTRGLPEDYEQFSQEIRVASPTNQPIEYLAGFYYQNDDLDSLLETGFGFVIPAFFPPGDPAIPFLPLGLAQGFSQDEDIYSVFGSVKWNATDRLSLGAGLRGSWVDKDYTLNLFYGSLTGEYGGIVPFPAGVQNPGGYFGQGVPGMLSGSRSDDDWTPSARIQYDITPEAMVYFSYANGFKSGGFKRPRNLRRGRQCALRPGVCGCLRGRPQERVVRQSAASEPCCVPERLH